MHLTDNFSASGPITQVPAAWFNRVAKFLNGLTQGPGIQFEKHDDGSPTIIQLAPTSHEVKSNVTVDASTDEHDGETVPTPLNPSDDEIWSANEGGKGFVENAILAVEYDQGEGVHKLWWVKKEYAPDGRLLRVRKFSDGGGMAYVGA